MITKLKKIKLLSLLFITNIIIIPKITFGNNENKNKEIPNIYLNFENTTLSSVVNYLSEQKKINIIPQKELDNIKVSLTTREPLTLNRAWDILLTLLEINGFTIIEVDNLYRIVQKGTNKQEPLPVYSGIELEKLPDNDTVVRLLYFLKNIKAETVQGFLSTMLEGSVQINRDLDALIITDKCLSIKSAMKIIEELDLGGLREAIKKIELKHSSAEDVAKLFEEISPTDQQKNIRFLGPQNNPNKPSTYFSRDTKIIPEPRQNALILLGLEKNIDKVINFIYKYIDMPIDSAESRLHIKELKYAKAENLKPILTNIILPPSNIPKTLQVGEYKFFQNVIIAADSSETTEGKGGGNRLIISCDPDDWNRLEKLINAIDKPEPQIAFEVMVVDVGITNDADLWAQFRPKKEGMFGKHINPKFYTATLPNTDQTKYPEIDLLYNSKADTDSGIRTGTSGTNITFGLPGSIWGIIKATLNKDNYNIIIQPYITANNNQECSIDATLTRQIPGEFSTQNLAGSIIRDKKSKDAKTTVKLTPKANLSGMIDLTISVEITDFQDAINTEDGNTITRTLDTRINVNAGEVIVLGGLTKSSHSEKTYKVPILGDIPIIGNLFKSKTNSKEKTNLYIFIRPSIIKPRLDAMPDEYTQMKLDFAKHQILGNDSFSKEKDPIQRWFFKPGKQSIKQKLSDTRKGIFRPIDNYATGLGQPKSVDIKNDKYFRPDIKREAKLKKTEIAKQTDENKTESRINSIQKINDKIKNIKLKSRRRST
ncbi:MAG: hypothetical protein ABIF12_00935 [bacterium]